MTSPRIELYEERVAVGIRDHVRPEDIPLIWQRLHDIAVREHLFAGASVPVGLAYTNGASDAASQIEYTACTVLALPRIVESLEAFPIPGGLFAVHQHVGPYDGLSSAFKRLRADVEALADRSIRDAPWMEIYLNDPINVEPAALRTDIAIPIH